jgi:hypothetical protein
MRSLFALAGLALALTGGPVLAAFDGGPASGWQAEEAQPLTLNDLVERRGRGRGRGGDDARDDRPGGGGGGHGGRPRIPGGSGCDDPGDIIEHPECRI